MVSKELFYKRPQPRVHAGDSYREYFEKRPGRASQQPSRGSASPKRLGNAAGNAASYFYWLVGGVACIAIIYFLGTFLKTSGVNGKLVYQEGDVQIKNGPDGDWKKAEADTKLKKLDEIKTMQGSRAIINLEEGSIIRLGELSRVVLTGEGNDVTVIQTDGSSYHRVAKSGERKYNVELTGIQGAEKTTIESLGTGFWIRKTGTDFSVGVLESKVSYKKEGAEDVSIDEGQKVVVEENKPTKKDIDTDDLDDEFIAWNLDQDKKKGLALSDFVSIKLAQKEVSSQSVIGSDVSSDSGDPAGESDSTDQAQNQEAPQITLTGKATKDGVVLTWELSGGGAPEGFKLVKGSQTDPAYPGSYYRSIRGSETKSYTWDTTDGKTYHFRVCVYDGSSGCTAYSNDVEVETIKKDKEELEKDCKDSGGAWDAATEKCNCGSDKELKDGQCVLTEDEDSSASATAEKNCTDSGGTWSSDNEKCTCPADEELKEERCVKEEDSDESYAESVGLSASNVEKYSVNLSWTLSGGSAPDGLRLVKGSEKNPTYPGSNPQTVSGETTSYTWKNLKKGETYYFRVCVWDGSKCVKYSNSAKVEIKK